MLQSLSDAAEGTGVIGKIQHTIVPPLSKFIEGISPPWNFAESIPETSSKLNF
jgi:hypothetical protein